VVALSAGRLERAIENNLVVVLLVLATSVHFVSLTIVRRSMRSTFEMYRNGVRQAAQFGSVHAYGFWSLLLFMWIWNFFRW